MTIASPRSGRYLAGLAALVALALSLTAMFAPAMTQAAGTLASDAFSRTVSNGWGDLDAGGSWLVTNNNEAMLSVDGGVGHMAHTQVGEFLSELKARVPDFSAADIDIRADFRAQAAPDDAGAVDQFVLYSRYEPEPDFRYYLKMVVEFANGQTVPTIRIDRQAIEFTPSIANGVASGPNDPTVWWTLRFQTVGTQIRAKAWPTASAEPLDWDVDFTDSLVTLPNQFGIGTYTNDITPAAVFDVDNVLVADASVPTPTPTATPAPTATPTPTHTPTPTPAPTVLRYAGADRYGTAAAVSHARYTTVPVPVVYIATGTAFADALSAGPAAALKGGPVLLVGPSLPVPNTTIAELQRLKPAKIVIVGGTGVVSTAVETKLHSYAPVVQRLAGADRYATSAKVSASTFTSVPVGVAYIATGANFPDALSGVPAAGRLHGPVLLTTGNDVPTVIMAELKRLKPTKIVVLGGAGVVSNTALNELKTVPSTVVRVAGTDRWQTAVAVSKALFPSGASVVYVANGMNFPDALAGGPPAVVQGAPLLLLQVNSIPAATSAEIMRLKARTIVILGGTGVVSTTVQNQLKALIGA